MPTKVNRRTVDLSLYPDLVVIHLGMRVNRVTGLKTLLGFGREYRSRSPRSRMLEMMDLAEAGIKELLTAQRAAIAEEKASRAK